MGNTQLIYFQGSQCWHQARGSEQFVKLYHTIIPSASAHISRTFGFRKWIHFSSTSNVRLKYNSCFSILNVLIESSIVDDAFPICSIVSMKSPGVPVIELPPFYWKIISTVHSKPVNDIMVMVSLHISTTLRPVCVLWAWRSGVTNYWKIIGHCGLGGSYLFTPILSPSVLVMMTISRGSELSAQPGGLRLSDNSQQNSYSIMFQSNLRVECFMSALLTLCFDIPIPISGVKSQRGSFKDSSCCKLKVQQFRILQINEE